MILRLPIHLPFNVKSSALVSNSQFMSLAIIILTTARWKSDSRDSLGFVWEGRQQKKAPDEGLTNEERKHEGKDQQQVAGGRGGETWREPWSGVRPWLCEDAAGGGRG